MGRNQRGARPEAQTLSVADSRCRPIADRQWGGGTGTLLRPWATLPPREVFRLKKGELELPAYPVHS